MLGVTVALRLFSPRGGVSCLVRFEAPPCGKMLRDGHQKKKKSDNRDKLAVTRHALPTRHY